MKRLFAGLALLSLSAVAASAETRCGWIENPTPGNYWLTDSEASWTISAQGGYEAEGTDNLPDFSAGEWVETNGSYGYGCACMDVTVTRGEEARIAEITSVRQLPLKKCKADKKLPKME